MVTEGSVSNGIITDRELKNHVRWIAQVKVTLITSESMEELRTSSGGQGEQVYWTEHENIVNVTEDACRDAWAEEIDPSQVWIVT